MSAALPPSWRLSGHRSGILYATFVGPTRTDEIADFIAALVAAMPDANARIVFDLRGLEGYNSETKEPLKAWLVKYKLAIAELTVVVPKTGMILKVVIAAIALATGVKILVREDLEEAAPFAAQ